MWLWPVREKGPLCVPAKAQLLLKPNWAAFPNYLHYSSGLHFQMPSFNLEQKLLSGLIYDPDLLTGPCGVPPPPGLHPLEVNQQSLGSPVSLPVICP